MKPRARRSASFVELFIAIRYNNMENIKNKAVTKNAR